MSLRAQPTLSIVVTSRNDDRGAEKGGRTSLFVKGLLHQTRRVGLRAELILVEWNPPAQAPRLHAVLPKPGPDDTLAIRCVTVPSEIHHRYRHGDTIPLYQMIAKNVGIRRAKADYVLCTNVDLLFSDQLCEVLAGGSFDPHAFYRANRVDVPDALDANLDVPAQLDFCARNVLRRLGFKGGPVRSASLPPDPRFPRILAPPKDPNWRYVLYLRVIDLAMAGAAWASGVFDRAIPKAQRAVERGVHRAAAGALKGVRAANSVFERAVDVALGARHRNPPEPLEPVPVPPPKSKELIAYDALDREACGDFMLMSKHAWLDIQGHVELDLDAGHLDSLALCAAAALGYKQVVLPAEACTYHMEHPLGWSSLSGVARMRHIARRPGLDFQTFFDAALELLRTGGRLDLNPPDWGLWGQKLEEHAL